MRGYCWNYAEIKGSKETSWIPDTWRTCRISCQVCPGGSQQSQGGEILHECHQPSRFPWIRYAKSNAVQLLHNVIPLLPAGMHSRPPHQTRSFLQAVLFVWNQAHHLDMLIATEICRMCSSNTTQQQVGREYQNYIKNLQHITQLTEPTQFKGLN